jgi:glycerol-3-phosphate dehydrogenase (NAD(P)+)
MKIGIIGFGSWGTSMSTVLDELGHDVKIYGRKQDNIEEAVASRVNEKYLPDIHLSESIQITEMIDEVILGREIIVIAVASQVVRKVLGPIINLIEPHQVLVNLSKGIEISSLKTISQVIEEMLPGQPFVGLSGPSHAEEVAKKLPTTLVAASKDLQLAEMIQDQFICDYLRIYTNQDIIGVELGGSLKNIIALGAGISDGLGYGDNTKAALMTRGIKEIAVLGEAMGANPDTFRGLSGIGDLIVTCTSMHSRNRRCGIMIGEGKTVDEAVEEVGMVVEGISTIKSAYNLANKLGVDAPITTELYHVVYEGADPRESVSKLMKRRKTHEMEDNKNW